MSSFPQMTISPNESRDLQHHRQDGRRIFTGQYVKVLTPGYTLRARDAARNGGGAAGSACPREPRRPSACTSHPVAGQRHQYVCVCVCARVCVCETDQIVSHCRSHTDTSASQGTEMRGRRRRAVRRARLSP